MNQDPVALLSFIRLSDKRQSGETLYQGDAGDFGTEPVRDPAGVYGWHGVVFGASSGAQACDTVAVLETIDVAVGADNRPADFVARDRGLR